MPARRGTHYAVSVVLCTWNPRGDVLARVLAALTRQTLPADEWELIVVDNASNPPVSAHLPAASGLRWRTVVEPVVGLTAARIRGIREATGDLLVFVDDDNVLDADYLAAAVNLATARPDLGAFGGRTSPDFEAPPPEWLRPFYSHLAVVECDRDVWSRQTFPHDVLPCGAGMCVRRALATAWADDVAADPRRLDFDYQLRLAHDLGASYGRLLTLRGDLRPGRRLRILARTILAWLGFKHRGPARAIDLAYYRGFLAGAARGAGGPLPPGK